MNRILIGADFLMSKESEQQNNTQWLFDFIKRPIEVALNSDSNNIIIKAEKFSVTGIGVFSRDKFFSLSPKVSELNKIDVQFFYDSKDVSEESVTYLERFLTQGDIFIAYELSRQTRDILDQIGVIYIDIWLHQVRYLDDVLFGFKSNNEDIQNILWQYSMDKELFYTYANRLKVQNYKGFKRSNVVIKPNSAVFVGQTLMDKAIYNNGKMMDLTDFKVEFKQLCNRHGHVYYSRHPFVKSGDEHIISFVKSFSNTSIVGEEVSTYHLLTHENIKKVCSISSSVAIEARYFGKDVDIYFRPVIDIDNEYASIFQSFFYETFWAKVFAPITNTFVHQKAKYSVTEFSDKKDKVRDALSFYWGYKKIDSLLALKQTVGGLFQSRGGNKPVGKPKMIHDMSYATFMGQADKHSVISFDIFDTLITRHWYSPTEVFTFMEKEVNDISRGKIDNFRQIRVFSQQEAMKNAQKIDEQDVTLDAIYDFMAGYFDLDKSMLERVKKAETRNEIASIRARNSGKDKFDYCMSRGYVVILTSDMYLPKEVITEMLEKVGINNYYKFYLSSELKKRKHGGDLFRLVLKDLKILPKDILHVGDNPAGDITSATSLGINAVKTPKSSELFARNGNNCKGVDDFFKKNRTETSSLVMSLIADRFFDSTDSMQKDTLFNTDQFQMGYMAYGPFMYSYSKWIQEEAKKKGITKLLFLSRDGKLMMDAYNALYQGGEEFIDNDYVYSSRKVIKLSSLDSMNKVWQVVRSPIYSTTLGSWLKNQFDLDTTDIDYKYIHDNGFESLDQAIGNKVNKEALYLLCKDLSPVIFQVAQKNKEAYISYLKSKGVNKANVAVVDIGYAGTMQKFFHNYLDNDVFGLYLATFETFSRNLDSKHSSGYLSDHEHDKDQSKTICTHRFLHESMLCAPEESFVKIESHSGILSPVFLENQSDQVRRSKVSLIHTGAVLFINELKNVVDELNVDYVLNRKLTTHILDSFMRYPSPKDAFLVQGIVFEDSFGPDATRYLIPPEEIIFTAKPSQVIWELGNRVLVNDLKKVNPTSVKKEIINKRSFSLIVERKLLYMIVRGDKKRRKYERNRLDFFMDSKVGFIRDYWGLFGKKL